MTQLASSPPPATRSLASATKRPDPVLLGLAAAVLAYDIAGGSNLAGPAMRSLTGWLLFVPFHLGTALFAYRIARSADAARSARRFWAAVSFAAACFLVGDIFQLVAVIPDPAEHSEGIPVQALCVNVGIVVVLVVMLTAPLGLRTAAERARFWLDTATVMAATAGFGAYFTVAADAVSFSAANMLRWVQDVLLGPVVFLVGVFVVVKLLSGGAPPFTRRCAVLLAAAAAIQGVAAGLEPTAPAGASNWIGVLNGTANGLLVAGARVQQLQVRADRGVLARRRRRRPYSRLPYLAVGATYALLVIVLARGGLDARAWAVLGSAIVSTGLVVVRQLAAFAENARLLTDLDNKVQELNQTEAVLRTSLRERDDLGDELLKQVAERLRRCLRETDTAARIGGDEFAVVLEEPVAGGFASVAERVVRALQTPYLLGEEQMVVCASVGVAVDQNGAHESGDLLREADVAMYAAKHQGKAGFQVFTAPGAPARITGDGLP